MQRLRGSVVLATSILLVTVLAVGVTSVGAVAQVKWGEVDPPPGSDELCVHPLTDELVLVGANEGVYRSVDAGQIWDLNLPLDYGGAADGIRDFAFASLTEGWAVGRESGTSDDAVVFRTEDAGYSWTKQLTYSPFGGDFFVAVDSFDEQHAIVLSRGGRVYWTVNGGAGWMYVDVPGIWYDISYTYPPGVGGAVAVITGPVGNIRQLFLYDNGTNSVWDVSDPATTEDLLAVEFLDNDNVLAVGNAEFQIESSNRGFIWTRKTAPLDPGFIGFADDYSDMCFVNDQEGFIAGERTNFFSGTDARLLQYTSDAGASWTVESLPSATGYGLWSVEMLSSSEGWVSRDEQLWHKTTASVDRHAGENRYRTAVEISEETLPGPISDYAVIATGKGFADALSASGLAGAYRAPLLLVGSSLESCVDDELQRLGVVDALIVGGEGSVPKAVEDLISDLGIAVTRFAGADRYETSALVARHIESAMGGGFKKTAFVARGDAFPDALAVSPWAFKLGAPVMLTRPGSFTTVVEQAMAEMDITTVYVAGGESAVSPAAQAEIDHIMTLNGGPPSTRLSGADRYATAAAVAEYGLAQGWGTASYIGVATGKNFPDALAGGVACGIMSGPIVLTPGNTLSQHAADVITDNERYDTDVRVFGGEGAVSVEVFGDLYEIFHPSLGP